jgi:hypothetical protein
MTAHDEARAWLADAFTDCPTDLTDQEAEGAVRFHYAGGWPAFLRECYGEEV